MIKPSSSQSRGSTCNCGKSLTAIAAIAVFVGLTLMIVSYFPEIGPIRASANSPAKQWEGSYKTAGCDIARCCCMTHINTKASSYSKVILSGRLRGMCDEGVTELAITRPLLDDGTVMQHTVVNSTVTYTLQGKTIKWTNNKVPECDGYAYPSTPTKLLQNMYYRVRREGRKEF